MVLELLEVVLFPISIVVATLIVNRTVKQHLTGVFHRRRQGH